MNSPRHIREWVSGSAVHAELVDLNVRSVGLPDLPEFYNPTKQHLDAQWREVHGRYRHLLSGWVVEGVDPATGDPMGWRRFKPDHPRTDAKTGKPQKYENAPGQPSRATFLAVPRHCAQLVADRCKVPLPENYLPGDFWLWVIGNNIPIVLTEGEKKAGTLITLGYAAIGLPGINSGYRSKDAEGNQIAAYLIPDLLHFCTLGRDVRICFDYETNPDKRQNVRRAAIKLGQLFSKAGCVVKVCILPGSEKGVDDFVVAGGNFDLVYNHGITLDAVEGLELWDLTYTPAQVITLLYIEGVEYPGAGLAAVKSAKGTGKTKQLIPIVEKAHAEGRRVLVLTHRISLGRAICKRLGIAWVDEVCTAGEGDLLGFGLCVDSLHPLSKAKFKSEEWRGAVVILDECEQVIWHMLASTTCQKERVSILDTFGTLLQTVLNSGGLVLLQDADLSDVSINFVREWTGHEAAPWLLLNKWQAEPWQVTHFDDSKPDALIAQVDEMIAAGQRLYVAVDAQKAKSPWSTQSLERRWATQSKSLRILRIDSETVADPNHPAYGCVDHLDEMITDYDLVIVSPSVGTGVSIDVRGHFDTVIGIFQGTVGDTDIRQALARVREAVPRLVWCARYGLGKIGNHSPQYKILDKWARTTNTKVAELLEATFDIDKASDPVCLRAWAKMGARLNASHLRLRARLIEALADEGHIITTAGKLDAESRKAIRIQQSEISEELTIEQTEAVAAAEPIDRAQAEKLADQTTKTTDERHQLERQRVADRYGIEVTPDLVRKNRDGWHPLIRLHYLVLAGLELAKSMDRKKLADGLAVGEGKLHTPDLKLSTGKVVALKSLGVLGFADPDKLWKADSPEVMALHKRAVQHRWQIKDHLGITVRPEASPMETLGRLLGLMGLSMTCVKREGSRDNRQRVYQFVSPTDGRERVFEQWRRRDEAVPDEADPLFGRMAA
jgi:Domain of unknown function (DUF3854)